MLRSDKIAGTGFEPVFAAYGAAVVPLQLNPQSRQPDLNRKPAVYETAALPLRYDGRKKVDNRKRSGASGLEDRYAADYTMPTYAGTGIKHFPLRPPC